MTRAKNTDVIVPGSVRVEVIHHDWTAATIRCGRCGHEFEVRIGGHTARCKACGRVCQLDTAVVPGGNVTPIRRRA